MQDDTPGYMVNPKQARSLEKKGFAAFKDIWDTASQGWLVDANRWGNLNSGERNVLNQVIERIKPSWPTSQLSTLEPSMKEWKMRSKSQNNTLLKPWAQKVATA